MTAPVGKVGLPLHDATVDALTPKPSRGASSDGMPKVWFWLIVGVCVVAVILAAVIPA